MITNLRDRLNDTLWGRRDSNAPRAMRIALRALRTVAVLIRDVTQGQLTLRAMSLVYTTLLSLVPFLALSFSVLKAFGVHSQIEPTLQRLLNPLGESSRELTGRIIGFIDNMNVGVLGSVGLALLIYTTLSLIQKIEESLNFIWHIARPRSLAERFSHYLSLLLVGPILVFSTLGITASVMNTEIVDRILDIQPFGLVFLGISRLVPYLLISGGFTFAYLFIPNTRVRFSAALIGGAAAGAAWQSAGWAFALFVASSGSYKAIYSGFAVLILFLIWLYVSWLILLIGGSIAFYAQHPEYLVARTGDPLGANRERERLALASMSLVAGNFLAGQPPPDVDELAQELITPAQAVQIVLDALALRGLLVSTGGDPVRYLPARDPERIALSEIIETVRSGDEGTPRIAPTVAPKTAPDSAPDGAPKSTPDSDFPHGAGVDDIVARIDQGVDAALSGLTLKAIATATVHRRAASTSTPHRPRAA